MTNYTIEIWEGFDNIIQSIFVDLESEKETNQAGLAACRAMQKSTGKKDLGYSIYITEERMKDYAKYI